MIHVIPIHVDNTQIHQEEVGIIVIVPVYLEWQAHLPTADQNAFWIKTVHQTKHANNRNV